MFGCCRSAGGNLKTVEMGVSVRHRLQVVIAAHDRFHKCPFESCAIDQY